MLVWMQTPFSRDYFRSRAKFTTHLASINSTDLRDVPIALPPLEIQREIMARVAAARLDIDAERAQVLDAWARAKSQLEAALLGSGAAGKRAGGSQRAGRRIKDAPRFSGRRKPYFPSMAA